MGEVPWAMPGYKAGMAVLEEFCTSRLRNFHSGRNDPNLSALSNLSPWFHFGMWCLICGGSEGCGQSVTRRKTFSVVGVACCLECYGTE